MSNASNAVVVAASPFNATRTTHVVPEGMLLSDIVSLSLNDARGQLLVRNGYVSVYCGDEHIPQELWSKVRPKEGVPVIIKALPQGGGGGGGDSGKQVLSIVASIAVIAAAAWAYSAVMAMGTPIYTVGAGGLITGVSSTTAGLAYVASAAVAIAGQLAVSALCPPPKQKMSNLSTGNYTTSRALSITGTGNQANLYGAVPVVYGRHKIFPSYAANPYTEMDGEDQYLRVLFDCGYGPLNLTEMKIGTTPLSEFEGVEIDVREGWDDDTEVTLFTQTPRVDEYSVLLEYNSPISRNTRTLTDEAVVIFGFNGLVSYGSNGGANDASVGFTVEYRTAGSSDAYSPALDVNNGTAKTALTFVDAPNGERYSDWITDGYLAGNATVKLTLACPATLVTSAGTTTLWGLCFRVWTKVDGEADWQVQYTTNGYVQANRSVDVSVVGKAGRKLNVRIERLYQSYYTPGVAAAANGGGYRACPDPSAISYSTANSAIVFTARVASSLQKTLQIKFPTRGQYEIRITRTTKDTESTQVYDDAYLVGIRSVQYEYPIKVTGHALVAMRIKASGQLNGVIDEFNVVAERYLPIYDDSTQTWSTGFTRNPAWAFVSVLCGAEAGKNALSYDRLDLDSIVAWADACEAPAPRTRLPDAVSSDTDEPYWQFDAVVDFETTKFELLRDICAVGRASLTSNNMKIGVVRDILQTTPVQVFSPRNSTGFKGTRTFTTLPHALKCRYIDPESDWKQATIIAYDDGYTEANASIFEEVEFWGCTRDTQAWREGRFHIAQARLRPDTYTLQTGIENLICTKGDLVGVVHDVVSWGIASGRIVSFEADSSGDIVSVTFDEIFPMEAATEYAVSVRSPDGTLEIYTPDTVEGESRTLSFTAEPIPAGDIAVGDFCLFGTSTSAYVECIVKEIQYAEEFTASLTLLDAAPAIHTADQVVIPAYTPQTTDDPKVNPPNPVDGLAFASIARVVNGAYQYDLAVSWRASEGPAPAAYEIYYQDGDTWRLQTSTTASNFSFYNVNRDATIRLAVVAMSATGKKLSIAESSQIILTPDIVEPPDVVNFYLDSVNGKIKFTWDVTGEVPAAYWRIRFAETDVGYANAVNEIAAAMAPGVESVARIGYYYIKAVDYYGTESINAAMAYNGTIGYSTANIVETLSDAPTWEGVKTNIEAVDGELTLATALFDDAPGLFDAAEGLFDFGGGAPVLTGYYYFDVGGVGYLDLLRVYTSRIVQSIAMTEQSGIAPYTSGVANATIEYSSTLDDPASSAAEWTVWQSFISSDVNARAFRFRVVLTTTDPFVWPFVSSAQVTVDMPDRIYALDQFTTNPAGSAISFPAFKSIRSIQVTVQNMQPGDSWQITSRTETGFTLTIYNSGVGVARVCDAIVVGYGEES